MGATKTARDTPKKKRTSPRRFSWTQRLVKSPRSRERLIAPVKWSREEVTQWLSSAARGAFQSVKVPTTLTGSQFVRMSPLVLKNMCGGDEALATKLHKCLRAEVTRCSVQQR